MVDSEGSPKISRGAVAWRLAKQSFIPLVVALAYATWDYQSTRIDDRTWSGFIKSLGLAFFLIMWFVGQWLRVEKQLNDTKQLSIIREELRAVRVALAGQVAPQPPAAPGALIPDPVSRALVAEAHATMDSGFTYSSLLTAGVALEHAIRAFATSRGIANSERQPVRKILEQLGVYLSPDVLKAATSLWRVRNALAHRRDEAILSDDGAREILDSYSRVIQLLAALSTAQHL